MKRKLISFVLPVYNEAEGLPGFYEALCEDAVDPLEAAGYSVELVFVNDGSRDATTDLLRNVAGKDQRVRVVGFSRNFGHQIAITAGLDYARGDVVIVMDTDLQDPPRVALELVHEWEQGSQVVYAVRRTRKDGFMKKLTARAFYRIIRWLSDYPIPENTGDFRLLDRAAADAMRQYREQSRYVRGIAAHIGFRQKPVMFDRDERHAGETHYPLRKMLRFAADAVFSFSDMPLRAMNRLGWAISFLSLLGIVYAVVAKVFFPEATVSGWTFIVVSIFFIGGIQLVMLGILGEYIGRIYAQSKDRPLYIVAEAYGEQAHESAK